MCGLPLPLRGAEVNPPPPAATPAPAAPAAAPVAIPTPATTLPPVATLETPSAGPASPPLSPALRPSSAAGQPAELPSSGSTTPASVNPDLEFELPSSDSSSPVRSTPLSPLAAPFFPGATSGNLGQSDDELEQEQVDFDFTPSPGPLVAPTLQLLTKEDLSKMYFSDFKMIDTNGSACFLTTGYTGEDGFEFSVPSENAVDLAKAILEKSEGNVRLTGLGSPDSLRLEAGLCLYGNDMEQHITPVEAGLSWAIGNRRKAEGGFLASSSFRKAQRSGVSA